MLARMPTLTPRAALAMLLAGGISLAGSLFTSLAAHAQGLGEITVDSALNEPLRASIELLDVSGLEESQLLVGIATPDEYEQAGLERSAQVSQIEFDVQLRPPGGSRVILRSRDRISEPFVILLVSVRWPSGRVLRDYTVLLDLPGTNAAGTVTATATAVTVAAATAGSDVYTVQSGDSLWEIAEQTRPDTGVSVPQMMIAVQRANEAAFVNNNINRLLSGRVLRIPTRDEISVIEPAAAVAQVNAQNQDVGLQPLGAAATAAAGAVRDELSVLGGDAAKASGGGSSDLAATITALEAELMLSEEDLDRALLENEELTAQLGELEEQIAILQNIVVMEYERIAQLQNSLAAQAEATDEALSAAGRAADLLAAANQPSATQGIVGQVLTLLQNNLVFIGTALALVLIALGVLVARARRAASDDDMDFTTAHVALADEAEEQGLLARLLARFRRRGDEDDYENEYPAMTDPDAPADVRLAGFDVDDIPDGLADGVDSDNESRPASAEPEPAVAEHVAVPEDFDSISVASNGGFDLGALRFDENDAKRADEAESASTPLHNPDECDTKLDLAVAYEAMGDIVGAVEILDEVMAEGNAAQADEARRLKTKWQHA